MASLVRTIQPQLTIRQQSARSAMLSHGLDALLVIHPGDIDWLTGFTGHDSIVLLTAKSIVLLTDFRYTEQAAIEAPWLRVIERKGKMADTLAGSLRSLKVAMIGFEANFTHVGSIENLKKSAYQLKPALKLQLKPLQDVLVNLRKFKDAGEVQIIRQAIQVAQDAFLAMRRKLRIGQTENDFAGQLVYEMRKRGASGSSFDSIIASGAPSSLPHYRPSDAPIRANQPLLVDWGAICQGYCSDLTRTLLLGKIAPKMKDIYQVCLEAQLSAIDCLQPGITNKQADKVARDIIKKAGYGKYFGHGLGHGIGKDIHEAPRLSHMVEEEELKPGMIVTVEPGIYLPGIGGVRIEDDVLITPNGHEVLSTLDKTLSGNHIR